jgi:hypothetical protein
MPTRHRSGCPEGARNPASRRVSLRVPRSSVMRRNHFAEPSSIRFLQGLSAACVRGDRRLFFFTS